MSPRPFDFLRAVEETVAGRATEFGAAARGKRMVVTTAMENFTTAAVGPPSTCDASSIPPWLTKFVGCTVSWEREKSATNSVCVRR